MKTWLREPLVHFVILGILLFGFYSIWENKIARADSTISVSVEDMQRLATIWASESGRAPNAEEVESLVAGYVREEALYREAKRMGLDEDDTIIRRRLAQKMNFFIAKESDQSEPSDSDLAAFFETRKARYDLPPRLSFSHIFISGDQPEAIAQQKISAVQEQLAKAGDKAEWRGMGDPFMLARSFAAIDAGEVSKLFGPEFSKSVFETKEAGWSEPIASRLGLHLIKVIDRRAGAEADLASVKDRVRADYFEYRDQNANSDAVDEIVGRYTIDIETPKP